MDSEDPTGFDSDEGGDEAEDSMPDYIEFINVWLDELTQDGTLTAVIRDKLFTAAELGEFWSIPTSMASGMLQQYRDANYNMDSRCLYVIAHEGPYGRGAPWRLQSTFHPVPEPTRNVYRRNQIRHIGWDLYDHLRKQIKSFGAETRQALVMLDEHTTTAAASRQRQAIRDFGRDVLFQGETDAKTRIDIILAAMGVPKGAQKEYFRYVRNAFWDYIEVMVEEEVAILDDMIARHSGGTTP